MSRILVIDDSRSVLQMAEMILEEVGHQVITAVNGKGVEELLQSVKLDLIITDIYMPDEDGLEVIAKRNRFCPQLLVVAMSGAVGPLNMLGVARRLGACQTMQKPFTKTDLLNVVGVALGPSFPHGSSPK